MFSVVIPLYNGEAYIRRCLDSVLAQTEPDYELIVVDDGSTDSSQSIVLAYDDDRIKLVVQENRGEGQARNRGVAEASGEWVAFIDADDIWGNDHIRELKILIQEFGDAGIVSTRSIELAAGKGPFKTARGRNWQRKRVDYFRQAGTTKGLLHSSSVAIKRTVFDRVGYFSSFRQGADTEFWVRVCLTFPCAVSDRPTSFYCRGTGGVMEQMWTQKMEEIKASETIRDIGPAVSYLADELEAGNVSEEERDSVAIFINSRIVTELRILLYNNKLDGMRRVGGFFIHPLLWRHRLWKAVASKPQVLLKSIYQARSGLRALYRFASRNVS